MQSLLEEVIVEWGTGAMYSASVSNKISAVRADHTEQSDFNLKKRCELAKEPTCHIKSTKKFAMLVFLLLLVV